MRYYANLFEGGIPPQFTLNCSARKIFLFLLINSVIYLYKYGLNGYLFYTLGYKSTVTLILLLQLLQLWSLGVL